MYFYVFYSWTFIFLKSYLCRVSFTANTNLQSNTVICDISGIVRVVRNLKYTEHNDATIVVHYKRPDRSAVGPSISLKLQITQLMCKHVHHLDHLRHPICVDVPNTGLTIIIIIIIITRMIFMVLSSWQSHCESSPGSFDECRLSAKVAANHFIITQPESWYSFYRPAEGGRLSQPRHCSKGVQPVPKAVYRSTWLSW